MTAVLPVSDRDDPRIAPFRAVRDRDLAGRPGLFIAEGEVVLRRLLSPASRFRPESLLLGETQAERLRPLLASVPPDLPIYVAGRTVLDAIVGFPLHRGVLAVARRGPPVAASKLLAALPDRAKMLVLAGLANHDNVGAAFRNAAAFGADAVLLDETSCDPLYRKAVRVSVGACLTVPFARGGSAASLLDTLEAAGVTPVALSPAGTEDVAAVRWPRRLALVLGAEGPGLPPALLGRCRTARISMAPGADSLNVATAAAVALHAARTNPAD